MTNPQTKFFADLCFFPCQILTTVGRRGLEALPQFFYFSLVSLKFQFIGLNGKFSEANMLRFELVLISLEPIPKIYKFGELITSYKMTDLCSIVLKNT